MPGLGVTTVRSRRVATWLCGVLVLGLAAWPSCGRKTPVRPPELVVPERIDDLTARPVAGGIELRWKRPERYADGSRMFDLAGFRIERRRDGEEFRSVADLSVTDRQRFRQARHWRWTDTTAEPGVGYAYRIRSYTTDGYVSAPSNVAEAVRPELSPGAMP